jgi:hypothetical protein
MYRIWTHNKLEDWMKHQPKEKDVVLVNVEDTLFEALHKRFDQGLKFNTTGKKNGQTRILKRLPNGIITCVHESAAIVVPDSLISKSFDDGKMTDSEVDNICSFCAMPSKYRCSKCHKESYCSLSCQKQDWAMHKSVCE